MIREIRKSKTSKNLRGGCGCSGGWITPLSTTRKISSTSKNLSNKHKKYKKSHKNKKNNNKNSNKKLSHLSRKNQRGGFVSGCQLATVTEPGFKIPGNLSAGISGLDIPEAKTYIYRGNCGSGCGNDHAGAF